MGREGSGLLIFPPTLQPRTTERATLQESVLPLKDSPLRPPGPSRNHRNIASGKTPGSPPPRKASFPRPGWAVQHAGPWGGSLRTGRSRILALGLQLLHTIDGVTFLRLRHFLSPLPL